MIQIIGRVQILGRSETIRKLKSDRNRRDLLTDERSRSRRGAWVICRAAREEANAEIAEILVEDVRVDNEESDSTSQGNAH